MKAEEHSTRAEAVAGWPVRITSYRIQGRYYAAVANVDPGARIARGEGDSREEAERIALEKARVRLGRTRVSPA